MKKILIRRKHINEDEAPQLQPALNANQAPAQPANNQQANNQALPALNNAQQLNGNNQQQGQGVDLNAAVANVNKFIGTLYQTIQNTVKENLVKSCPEVDAISKDLNSPLKDAVKKMNDSFLNFTKTPVKVDDPKNVADTITAFTTFISALSEFNSNLTAESQKATDANAQGQLNNQQLQNPNNQLLNNQAQAQLPQQPAAQGNVNASYDPSLFGKALAEKLRIANHERACRYNF